MVFGFKRLRNKEAVDSWSVRAAQCTETDCNPPFSAAFSKAAALFSVGWQAAIDTKRTEEMRNRVNIGRAYKLSDAILTRATAVIH